MRGHKPGALNPTPGVSVFPTLCAAASALSWRDTCHYSGSLLAPKVNLGKWVRGWIHAVRSLGVLRAHLVREKSTPSAERQWGLMGNCYLESSQIMRYWRADSSGSAGALWAKCQLSGTNNWKNQMSQMEENVVFKRSKNQNKTICLFFTLIYSLWGKKKDTFIIHI